MAVNPIQGFRPVAPVWGCVRITLSPEKMFAIYILHTYSGCLGGYVASSSATVRWSSEIGLTNQFRPIHSFPPELPIQPLETVSAGIAISHFSDTNHRTKSCCQNGRSSNLCRQLYFEKRKIALQGPRIDRGVVREMVLDWPGASTLKSSGSPKLMPRSEDVESRFAS